MGRLEVRELHGAAEAVAAARLLAAVWRTETEPLDPATLVALAHSGNHVAVAVLDGAMVGACAGFFGPPAARTLHSHIAGVLPEAAGRGVGAALKRHQREWCLERGTDAITWTFDPVIARNAHFNLVRLGARLTAYERDLYGPMPDGLNAGAPSDRALVRWDLTAAAPGAVGDDGAVVLRAGEDDRPVAAADGTGVVRVGLPHDVEGLRRDRPEVAAEWRLAVRRELGDRLADGWRVDGYSAAGYRMTEERG